MDHLAFLPQSKGPGLAVSVVLGGSGQGVLHFGVLAQKVKPFFHVVDLFNGGLVGCLGSVQSGKFRGVHPGKGLLLGTAL